MDTRKFRNSPDTDPAMEAGLGVLTLDDARLVLSNSARLLDDLVGLARVVVRAVPAEVAVAVFVHDQPAPIETPTEPTRTRRHPLLAFFRMALSASRLQRQVVAALYPELRDETVDAGAANALETLVNNLRSQARSLGIDPDAA